MSSLLRISPSPHQYGDASVSKIMYAVILALIPAQAASIYYFGIGSVIVSLVAILACVGFEWLIQKYLMKVNPSISDGSAVLTGLLLAFNVPTNLPIGLIIIGSFIAIAVGKLSFGGLGQNPFNPALVGRVFLLISFPVQMTTWPKPLINRAVYLDAETGATPLAIVKEALKNGTPFSEIDIPGNLDLFLGNLGGSAGEISALALLIGGVYMIWRKIITWHIPVYTLLSIAFFAGVFHLADPQQFADPIFHLLTGGAMLGAIFMATDMVTSPMSIKGQIIFAIGIGFITIIIRAFGAYPEGVSFAILIMNAFVPLLNSSFKPKKFGEVKSNG
jgi:Na+-translocating ferredoxin:NAD+ oxidoreductase subunit D